jgi:hypothetical protein
MVVFQMALGRGLCPDTSGVGKKSSVKPRCQRIRTRATDLSRSDGRRIEIHRREDKEEVADVGSEHESVSGECETEDGN